MHDFFFRKWFPTGCIFGQGEDFKLTTELSEKVQCSRNQAIKNGLDGAILLMSINEALLSDKTLCLSGNQDLTVYEDDSNF